MEWKEILRPTKWRIAFAVIVAFIIAWFITAFFNRGGIVGPCPFIYSHPLISFVMIFIPLVIIIHLINCLILFLIK